MSWTTPHQHATYTGSVSNNYLTVLTAQNNVDTTAATSGSKNIDNVGFLEFFASADAGDGYTPAVQFVSHDVNTPINQFMAVHSDEETFIYWVYSRDSIVTAGEAVKIAEINGHLFAEDFAIYDGSLDVYNFGELDPIVIYTPSITSVGYNADKADALGDSGDVAVIEQDGAVVLPGGGRFEIEGQFFKAIGVQENPFSTQSGSDIVTVTYDGHGLSINDWVQISGAAPANGIDFNGTYQVQNVSANSFTFTATNFVNQGADDPTSTVVATAADVSDGAAGVSATFAVAGTISEGSTIKVYDGIDRLDANPLTEEDDVRIEVSGDSFTLYDERAIGTSLRQAPDGVVTESSDIYKDAQGNAAFLEIDDGSNIVFVNYTGHGLVVGDSITIAGSTAAGGIDFNGTWVVSSRPNSDKFTFVAGQSATATQNVNTNFSFTKVSAPVDVAVTDMSGAAGVLTVTMADHGMLSGDVVTFTSNFDVNSDRYEANEAYSVTRINDDQFSIVSSSAGSGTSSGNVTFSVPNGGDQTFFLKDEKVSYYVEVKNADSGFETMSLQYNFTVGGGNTTLNGGRGDDTLVISDESVSLNGMLDAQIVNLETIQITNDVADTLTVNLSLQTDGFTIYDSGAGNSVVGSQGEDVINGFGGDDTINGENGNDTIIGGAGADSLNGGGGVNTLSYEDVTTASSHGLTAVSGVAINLTSSTITASDVATYMGGAVLGGGAGTAGAYLADGTVAYLATGASASTIGMVRDSVANFSAVIGSELDDFIALGNGGMFANGGAGSDVIIGGDGNDTLFGGTGDDSLIGGAGNDSIVAGAGNDTIVGSQEDVLLDGGDGTADVLKIGANFEDTSNGQIENIELVELTANGLTVSLNDQSEGLSIAGFQAGASTIAGGSGNDTILGGAGNDSLIAGAGNDTIDGGAGNDTLSGGIGDDLITGGAGADSMNGGGGEDIFKYLSNSDSTYTSMDVITDFTFGASGDKLDLSAIDGAGDVGYSTQNFATLSDLQTYATSDLTALTTNSDDLEVFVGLVNGSNTSENGAYVLAHSNDMMDWTTSDTNSTIIKLDGISSLSDIAATNFVDIGDFYNVTTVVIGSNSDSSNLSFVSGGVENVKSPTGNDVWYGSGGDDEGGAGYQNAQVEVGWEISGLTEVSFTPGGQISVPDGFSNYGDDAVDPNQYEVFLGTFSGGEFEVTGNNANSFSAAGATHTMILYDNDGDHVGDPFWIDGLVMSGVYTESGWAVVDPSGPGNNYLTWSQPI